jgi:hypothetical protein
LELPSPCAMSDTPLPALGRDSVVDGDPAEVALDELVYSLLPGSSYAQAEDREHIRKKVKTTLRLVVDSAVQRTRDDVNMGPALSTYTCHPKGSGKDVDLDLTHRIWINPGLTTRTASKQKSHVERYHSVSIPSLKL